MRLPPPSRSHRNEKRAYTLVEIVVSMGIGVLVLGFFGVTILTTAYEQRQALVQASLETEVCLVSDKLAGLLRSMSSTESVVFTDVVPGKTGCYRTIIVAQGEIASYPREVISFNASTNTVTHDPNRNSAGDVRVLSLPTSTTVLRELYFYPSCASDGRSDSTTLNVFLQLDDNGSGGRRNTDGTQKRITVTRSFAIKMRNK